MNAGTIWTKVKSLDKRLVNFLSHSFLLILLLASLAAFFTHVYNSFSLDTYNSVLFILILMSIIITFVVAAAMLAVFLAWKSGKVGPVLVLPVRLGMKIVIPFAIFVAGMFKGDKDTIRGLFVDINNIFVQSGRTGCEPGQLLVLLPHCLQNSECACRVTNDINNCRQCGRCSIGSILGIVREKGVKAAVVTGGTAARNLVARQKPKMILSVACERDLALGITDVSSIPVVGVVNQRPNGPCFNTNVDVALFADKLESLLKKRDEN